MINKKKLAIRIFSLIFFISFINFLALKFHWYLSIWWLDMLMHLLGGFWVGLAFLWIFPLKDLTFESILKISFGFLIVSISWEIFEIMVDKTITKNPFNLLDTLSDLSFGLAGTIFALAYFLRKIMTREEIKV